MNISTEPPVGDLENMRSQRYTLKCSSEIKILLMGEMMKYFLLLLCISLYGCGFADGEIRYKFKGKVTALSSDVDSLKVEAGFHNPVMFDSLRGLYVSGHTLTDSLGNYNIAFSHSCGGNVGLFGGESNCDSRIENATIYIAAQCRVIDWKVDNFQNIKISNETTIPPDYYYESHCEGDL